LKKTKSFSSDRRSFEKLVREAIAGLPRELRDRLENVAILIEDQPRSSPEESGDGGELLGLYHGVSRKDRGFWYGNTLPDRIIIYRRPLESISSTLEELRENVRQTVVHEVGHYFGFDEEELQDLEEDDPGSP
jgi:predicted Zn-dependent protease with MMP-like domain